MCNFRIKELTVTNYRKFERKTFQLNPTMNVFAGKNGSGKTAALEAAVVMMGAVINIGDVIGEGTMVDMNAVVGARGILGKNVHLGACSVVAGVLEPPSATPVIVEDDVLIGANCVILEGVRIGKSAVVAAGSVVTKDVEPGAVVAGSPAKVVKMKDEKTATKTQLMNDLRG